MTPLNLDRSHFTILCRAPDGSIYSAERDGLDLTDRKRVVSDILTGEVSHVLTVIEFNPAEHICDDVSEDIARDVARMIGDALVVRADLRDFIESACGLGVALPVVRFEPARMRA